MEKIKLNFSDIEKTPKSSENVKSGEIVSLDAFRDKK